MKKYIPRAYVREKVDIPAQLIIRAQQLMVIPARIVDRSEGGMKVEMAIACPLPERVYLQIAECEDLYECERRWENEQAVGLMLIGICRHSTRKEVLGKLRGALVLEPPPEDELAPLSI